jgi:hypothetical protein
MTQPSRALIVDDEPFNVELCPVLGPRTEPDPEARAGFCRSLVAASSDGEA